MYNITKRCSSITSYKNQGTKCKRMVYIIDGDASVSIFFIKCMRKTISAQLILPRAIVYLNKNKLRSLKNETSIFHC